MLEKNYYMIFTPFIFKLNFTKIKMIILTFLRDFVRITNPLKISQNFEQSRLKHLAP